MAKTKKKRTRKTPQTCAARLHALLLRASKGPSSPRAVDLFLRQCVEQDRSKKKKSAKKRRGLAGARSAPLPAGKQFAADQTGRGHCVYSPDNRLVRCFSKMKTAEDVARGFGSGFHVKHPNKRRG